PPTYNRKRYKGQVTAGRRSFASGPQAAEILFRVGFSRGRARIRRAVVPGPVGALIVPARRVARVVRVVRRAGQIQIDQPRGRDGLVLLPGNEVEIDVV